MASLDVIARTRNPFHSVAAASLTGLLALSLGTSFALAEDIANEQSDPPRFSIDQPSISRQTSACGRFTLDANARYAPEGISADGRFSLKAVNAPEGGCELAGGVLFADGFESP